MKQYVEGARKKNRSIINVRKLPVQPDPEGCPLWLSG